MASFYYRLPWPPSMNTYWRRGGNVTYLTKRAKEFRSEVADCVREHFDYKGRETLRGRLALHLELTMPDRRRRDIDNHIKAAIDALQHAGLFYDDEQVDEIRIKRLHVEPPGACDVTICELE